VAKKSKYIVSKPDLLLAVKTNKKHSDAIFRAMHYAQYEMSDKELKKEMIRYAKAQKLNFKLLNVLTDKELAMAGKYAFIVNGGGELTDVLETSYARYLDTLFARAKVVQAERKAAAKEKAKNDVNAGPVLTVQDRMRIQAEEVCQEFDGWMDQLSTGQVKSVTKEMNPGSKLAAAGFKAGQARYVKSFYEPELAMIKEVIAGKCPDLKEGYNNIAKSSLLRMQKLLDSIIKEAKVIETVTKAKRKTRAKKAPSVTKLIGKLKYCEAHPETGVASVSPAGIIGATEVWVYNTKYRKLGKFVASDAAGLSIKGTSITDFAADSSRCKTLRKPEQQLKDFMKAGKVKLRTFLDDIKAVDSKMKGRMNENIVILKVFK